jgi:hypothetical protein
LERLKRQTRDIILIFPFLVRFVLLVDKQLLPTNKLVQLLRNKTKQKKEKKKKKKKKKPCLRAAYLFN